MVVKVLVRKSAQPALVDDEFSMLINYKWSLNHQGYPIRHSEKTIKLHHAIMGKPGKGMVVDHINRDKLDNRKSNLRVISSAENAQNVGAQKRNITGIRGVHYRKDTGRYLAHCCVKGKRHLLGYYDDPIKAGQVVSLFRRKNMPYSNELDHG